MRHVFENPSEVARRGKRARADIEAHFSETSVAQVVSERLAVIPRVSGLRNTEHIRSRPPEIKGHPDYQGLVSRVRLAVEANTQADATLAVVSRGDELLLDLGGRTAWHFPRNGDGAYAGYYPTDSAAAVAHLEQLRANGAEYLVIPASSGWWLEYYAEMREHLETGYQLVYDDPRTGTIYALSPVRADALPRRRGDLAARAEALEERIVELDRVPASSIGASRPRSPGAERSANRSRPKLHVYAARWPSSKSAPPSLRLCLRVRPVSSARLPSASHPTANFPMYPRPTAQATEQLNGVD